MAAMSTRRTTASEPDPSPLAEGALRSIVGYQLTQANISMLAVFTDSVGGPCHDGTLTIP